MKNRPILTSLTGAMIDCSAYRCYHEHCWISTEDQRGQGAFYTRRAPGPSTASSTIYLSAVMSKGPGKGEKKQLKHGNKKSLRNQ